MSSEEDLSLKLQETQDLVANLKNQNADLQQQYQDCKKQTIEYYEKLRSWIQKAQNLEETLKEKENYLSNLKTDIGAEQKTNTTLTTKLEAAKREINQLKKEHSRLLEENEQACEESKAALILNRYVRQLLEESERGKIFLMILELGGQCNIDELASELNLPPVLVLQQLRYFYTQKIVGLDLEDREVWLIDEEENGLQ